MENLTSKLDGTARHLIHEGEAFVVRTRDAGQAFIDETEKAGAVFVKAARTEVRSWVRALRTTRNGLRKPAAVARLRPEIERRVLTQVEAGLTSAAERVRARLGELEPRPVPVARRQPPKARPRRGAKPKPQAVSIAA